METAPSSLRQQDVAEAVAVESPAATMSQLAGDLAARARDWR
jgi:hypothetical protein